MNGPSHEATTHAAFELLANLDSRFKNWLYAYKADAVTQSSATDLFPDVEFVDVEGDRDDPHGDGNDIPSRGEMDENFTAYNHFIDIKKGPGVFDDFDGYSYHRGSASVDEFEDATEDLKVKKDLLVWLAANFSGAKIDEGIAYWLNDDYVHAPGHPWYRYGACSPALERYSFYQDRGLYPSVEAECLARFPLAECTGGEGKGFPYSVFMPVDNLARYWYTRFCTTMDPRALGPVLHAAQDASIPQHAAGYSGNWHTAYECALEAQIGNYLHDASTTAAAIQLFEAWNKDDPQPPTTLGVGDWSRTPGRNWRVDMLVTWVALNAFRSYDQIYDHDWDVFHLDMQDGKQLLIKVLAACMLILSNAASVPYCAPLSETSFGQCIAQKGWGRPFSWRQQLPGYPRSLHAVLYILNATSTNQNMPFP